MAAAPEGPRVELCQPVGDDQRQRKTGVLCLQRQAGNQPRWKGAGPFWPEPQNHETWKQVESEGPCHHRKQKLVSSTARPSSEEKTSGAAESAV